MKIPPLRCLLFIQLPSVLSVKSVVEFPAFGDTLILDRMTNCSEFNSVNFVNSVKKFAVYPLSRVQRISRLKFPPFSLPVWPGIAPHQPPGVVNDIIPLKGRPGVNLVGLDVIMSQHPLILLEIGIRQLVIDDVTGGVAGVIALDFREYPAEGRREMNQGLVLLGGVILLLQALPLHHAPYRAGSGGVADKIGRVLGVRAVTRGNG